MTARPRSVFGWTFRVWTRPWNRSPPNLRIEVPKQYCPESWVTVAPRSLRDFRPERLIHVCPYLDALDGARKLMTEARSSGGDAGAVARDIRGKWPQLPLDLDTGDASASASSSASAVDDILAMVAAPQAPTQSGISGWITQVEGLMAGVLDAIYADAGYRACEASWRGARLVLEQSGAKEGGGIALYLANVPTHDASVLARVLEDLIPELAGELPNLALVDAFLDSAPQRIELARKVAAFAETLLLPTYVGVGPEFFRLESWAGLGRIPYVQHFLEDMAFAKWRNLRKEAGAQWLAAGMNGLLARPPYGQDNPPRTPFFTERTPLWLNPVWGLGALTAMSVARHGWPSRVTDYHSVQLANQPVLDVDNGSMACQTPLGEDRVAEFAGAGFAPLLGAQYKDIALAPMLHSIAGEDLSPQLFLNRVLGFLFWCKDNLAAQIESDGFQGVAENLQAAFGFFWQKTGHATPGDLEIKAGEGEEGSLPLAIRFTPPHDVLPAAQTLEFTFSW